MSRFRSFFLLLAAVTTVRAQPVFINEFHYDNTGTDSNEGIEIAGPAGTALIDYDVVLYNGNGGAQYASLRLFGAIPNQGGGAGAVWFDLAGIQNGDASSTGPDGMVLYHWPTATVVQKISYEGSFTAVGGVAAGMVLPNIGVFENASTVGHSLQLIGTGMELANFTWAGPRSSSRGSLNAGQTFTATAVRTAALAVLPGLLTEGQGGTLTLILTPPPPANITFALQTNGPAALSLPAQITVGTSGTAYVPVTALTDGVADGFQEVSVFAQPPDAFYLPAAGGVQIIDADRPQFTPPGSIRLMSFNVKFGVGTPGSAEFNAVREVVERLSPDVLVMQEVSSPNFFADWLILVQQAGFPVDDEHLAIQGDAYAGQGYARGDITGGQDLNVVTVSRFPIRQRIQCMRGSAGRAEITRYPMLTVVDVPWLPDSGDPAIVNVHLKAGGEEADNFRRALEARRTREVMTAAGITGATRNVIVAGDFNATDWLPQPASYQTNISAVTMPGTGQFPDGTRLPTSFVGGSDLTSPGFTLPYDSFPHSGFNPHGLSALNLKQADGSDERTFAFASYKLDYFFVSQPILARGGVQTEIYNSRLEAAHDGLPKRRTLPAPALSTTATDHFAVIADIPLLTQPALSVTFSRAWVFEGDTTLTATISMMPPPAANVSGSLEAWRDGRIALPSPVVLGPGHSSITVPVSVPHLPGIEPHRGVAVTATATGCHRGTGSVEVRNLEASGLLVISQYVEPDTGSGPHALELLNMSGTALDLTETPLVIRRFSNGATDGVTDAEATSGILPAGAVLVVGDEVVGDYLVAQGLLPAPATPFASQLEHTVSLNAAGAAAFVLDHMTFTGNDAMEVLLSGTRCDVFGEIGHDPGIAWAGPGAETTSNGVLSLRPSVATGSGGWRQPGRRFTFVAGASLAGFGIAPVVTDPYYVWTAAAGLSGLAAAPASDPDGDGAPNLAEFGLMTSPVNGASHPPLSLQQGSFVRFVRTSDPSLTISVESSLDCAVWQPASGFETNVQFYSDSVERIFTLIAPPAGRLFLRQRVSRP